MIHQKITETLSKKGINLQIGNTYDMISVWKSWYRGNVNDFHYYNVTLADGTIKLAERLTMNMPKKLCEDYAKLIWNDEVEISLNNKGNSKRLWEILNSNENNFSTMFPQFIEKTYALGTGALVEYKDDDKIKIDYLEADVIIPHKYNNGYISGLITISQFTEEKRIKYYYTHLTFHELVDGKYIKYNELYKSTKENELGKEINFEDYYNMPSLMTFDTNTPHFQVFKLPIANNLNLKCSMGMSVYGNSIDRFKAIDSKYDLFTKEFELGKKRITVDATAVKKRVETDATGDTRFVSYFDKNDTVFQAIAGMESQPIKEIDFKLRHREFIESINAELNWLSANVGLGNEFYNFDGSAVKTATEVISENSDTFRTKKHHELMVKQVLKGLIKAVMELDGKLIQDKDITITFDDSIINDEDAYIDRGLKLFNAKVISKETFLRDYMSFDDKQIEEEKMRLSEENKIVLPEAVDFFGS